MNKTVRKILIWSGVGCVVAFGAAFALGYYDGYREAHAPGSTDGGISGWLFLAFAAVGMTVGVWVSAIWMRSIDEAAQEAHKWAWYWGGSIGMAVAGVIGMMAVLPQSALVTLPSVFPDRADPAAYMATGAVGMGLLMMAGYTIAWAVWWLRHR